MSSHPAGLDRCTPEGVVSRARLSHRKSAPSSLVGMAFVEIVVVVAIVLVLTSVLSFGIYNIYEDSKRQVALLETGELGEQMFVNSVARSPLFHTDRPDPMADGQ